MFPIYVRSKCCLWIGGDGLHFQQNYLTDFKKSAKAGLDSNKYYLIFMNLNLERAHIARHSRRKMR